MSIQSTEPSIAYLDFDPEVPEPEKEPEEPKTCGLALPHPLNKKDFSICGRPAVYQVSLKKPCGHHSDLYLCQSCWGAVESGVQKFYHCRRMVDGVKCGTQFEVKPAIVRWEKL